MLTGLSGLSGGGVGFGGELPWETVQLDPLNLVSMTSYGVTPDMAKGVILTWESPDSGIPTGVNIQLFDNSSIPFANITTAQEETTYTFSTTSGNFDAVLINLGGDYPLEHKHFLDSSSVRSSPQVTVLDNFDPVTGLDAVPNTDLGELPISWTDPLTDIPTGTIHVRVYSTDFLTTYFDTTVAAGLQNVSGVGIPLGPVVVGVINETDNSAIKLSSGESRVSVTLERKMAMPTIDGIVDHGDGRLRFYWTPNEAAIDIDHFEVKIIDDASSVILATLSIANNVNEAYYYGLNSYRASVQTIKATSLTYRLDSDINIFLGAGIPVVKTDLPVPVITSSTFDGFSTVTLVYNQADYSGTNLSGDGPHYRVEFWVDGAVNQTINRPPLQPNYSGLFPEDTVQLSFFETGHTLQFKITNVSNATPEFNDSATVDSSTF